MFLNMSLNQNVLDMNLNQKWSPLTPLAVAVCFAAHNSLEVFFLVDALTLIGYALG